MWAARRSHERGKPRPRKGVLARLMALKKPPKLHLKDITKEIDDGEGGEVEVHYLVSAEIAEGAPIPLSCNPPSDSKFPVGQTTIVTCEAADNEPDLTTKGSFKVALPRKSEALEDQSLVKDGVA